MARRSWLISSIFVLAACGSKTEPSPQTAEPAKTTAPTDAPATSAAPTAEADASSAPTSPPPTIEAATTATTATAEADVVAAVEDAAPAPVDDAAPTTTAEADTTGSTALTPEALAELPKVSGMPPEVVARLLSGEPGCVGMGKSGRSVVSILEYGDAKKVRVTDLATPERGFSETTLPLSTKESIATDEIATLAKGLRLAPCQTIPLDRASGGTVPKPVPIVIGSSGGTITAQIAGNKAVVIDADHGHVQYFQPIAAYWSEEIGNFFLRLEKAGADIDFAQDDSYGTVVVNATELGLSECIARPVEGKPLPTTPPAPFTAKQQTPSCIAMTADGKQAAFRLFNTIEGESGPNSVAWFGEGTPPSVDLSCYARGCKADQQAAAEAAAKEAGLVMCPEVKGAVAIDGILAPWMYQADQLKLKTTTGWRTVHELAVSSEGEGPNEKVWRQYQHPGGGPIFVYVGTEVGDQSKADVLVLDEAKLSLCDKAPAGTQKIAEVKIVSAAPDGGGYKFGGIQLVDGDVSTSWQPAAKKEGDTTAAWVELVLGAEAEVAAVEIANGFQRKDGNGDMFALNARIKDATLTFSDGSSEKVTFGPDERGFKRVELAPRKTTSVKLTVDALHDGARWPKDLAISEIRVIAK